MINVVNARVVTTKGTTGMALGEGTIAVVTNSIQDASRVNNTSRVPPP